MSSAAATNSRRTQSKGVSEAGEAAGPILKSTAAALLLLFCFPNSRSLARSLRKDPDEEEEEQQQQQGASGRRTSEENYNNASICSLARRFFLVAKIQTLARGFFFWLMERWCWCRFFIAWRDLCFARVDRISFDFWLEICCC